MTAVVDRLISKIETNPGAVRIWVNFDASSYPNAREATREQEHLRALASLGALKASYGKGGFRDRIEKVSVADAGKLYAAVGRRPMSETAAASTVVLRAGSEPWEEGILGTIERAWAAHRRWQGFGIDQAASLLPIQRIARALRLGLNEGLDMRTFSTHHGGDSKLIERHGPAILAYAYYDRERPEGSLREILERSGTSKLTTPVTVSGPFSVGGHPVGSFMDYCGLPSHDLKRFTLDREPDYVLTIENHVSFHRHAVEINYDRRGLVLFSSGHASWAFMEFYRRLVSEIGHSVPFFHWSDIDAGGLEITKTILGANPSVRPHLMSLDLVRKHGARTSAPVKDEGRFADTWMEDIARHLALPESLTLEQEMLDPVHPAS